MSYRMCRAAGCHERAATRYGVYCNAHRSRLKRHGAVNQEPISKADLRVYEKLVEDRIERNKNKAIWPQLEARWAAVVRDAQEVVEQWRKGVPMPSFKRIAAFEIVKLSNAVEPGALIKTVLAMFLMQDQEPRKFRSDKAFLTQMVRRVRGLTKLNAGTWKDQGTGKTKVAYRELNT